VPETIGIIPGGANLGRMLKHLDFCLLTRSTTVPDANVREDVTFA
jgi:hypothetical protein